MDSGLCGVYELNGQVKRDGALVNIKVNTVLYQVNKKRSEV
jgi:hypothetical protein